MTEFPHITFAGYSVYSECGLTRFRAVNADEKKILIFDAESINGLILAKPIVLHDRYTGRSYRSHKFIGKYEKMAENMAKKLVAEGMLADITERYH